MSKSYRCLQNGGRVLKNSTEEHPLARVLDKMNSKLSGTNVYKKGKVLDRRYKIEKEIGEGGFANVFECYDQINREKVAVKVFKSSFDARTEYQRMKFVDQRNGVKLNLVKMLRKFVDEYDRACIVYPLMGPDVEKAMKTNKSPFGIQEVRHMAYQLVCTANSLHKRGIAHTDIKPANIMLKKNYFDPDSEDFGRTDVFLADFGSASVDGDLSHETVTTLPYRAPEVLMGAEWDHSCDVWSIGCTLFEMFTGEKLFKGIYDEEEMKWFMRKCFQHFPKSITAAIKNPPTSQEIYSVKYPKVERLACIINAHFNNGNKDEHDLFKVVVEMLKCDPNERISLTEVLKLPFFDKCKKVDQVRLDETCLKELEKLRVQAAMFL